MKFLMMISSLLLGLHVITTDVYAKPCRHEEACFEVMHRAPGPWNNPTQEVVNQKLPSGCFIKVNNHRAQLFYHSLTNQKEVYHSVAVVAPDEVFQEGSNQINVELNGTGIAGTVFQLFYYPRGIRSSVSVCSDALSHNTHNLVNCGNFNRPLSQIDEVTAREIENLKRNIAELPRRLQSAVDRKIQAFSEKERYLKEEKEVTQQIQNLEERINLLNAELNRLNFADFDSISLDQMTELLAENPAIRELYNGLKTSVDGLKTNIERKVQETQNEINTVVNELQTQLNQTAPADVHFDVPFSDVGENSFDIPFTAETPFNAEDPMGQSASKVVEETFENVNQQVINQLQEAMDRGDQAAFVGIFSNWNRFQQNTIQALRNQNATVGALHRAEAKLFEVFQFVRTHLDSYGFFSTAKVPSHIKRIVGKKLKDWNEEFSREFVEELNTWNHDLNPTQRKVLQEIEQLSLALDRINSAQFKSDEGKSANQTELREVVTRSLREGVETLIQAAHLAPHAATQTQARDEDEGGGVEETKGGGVEETKGGGQGEEEEQFSEADELLAEADASIKIANELAGLVLDFIPVVSTAKDWYEAIVGKKVPGGEALTLSERAFSGVSGLVALMTVGGSNYVKGATKAAIKAGGKGATVSRSMKIAEKVAESAARNWTSVKGLLHTVKGNIKLAVDGTFKLKSGMHTEKGLEHFLKLNAGKGKNYRIQTVTSFGEKNVAEGIILREKLSNGVTRLQLPREAWHNNDAFGKAITKIDEQKIKGAKTLWPDSFSVSDVAEATEAVLTQNAGSTGTAFSGMFKGIKIEIKLDSAGKVITAYPSWHQ